MSDTMNLQAFQANQAYWQRRAEYAAQALQSGEQAAHACRTANTVQEAARAITLEAYRLLRLANQMHPITRKPNHEQY